MSAARALLVPSLWYEPSGRVVLEAYAAGVPVVASRIGGLPEIVDDNVSGLLVEPGDRNGWAASVERLSNDAESRRLGEGAWRLWSERFTPDHGRKHLENAYEHALRTFRARFGQRP
jgi:glycosyltransferase involved in cell wall biosynthesis